MSPAEKRRVRASEYRALADHAGAAAEASPLAHVREKHRHAAARWMALALRDEAPLQAPPVAAGA